jgi:hypothetical protein
MGAALSMYSVFQDQTFNLSRLLRNARHFSKEGCIAIVDSIFSPLPGVVLRMRSSPSRSSKVNFAPKKVPVLIFRSVGIESSLGAGSALPGETNEITATQASQNRQRVAEKRLGIICTLRYKVFAPTELLLSRMGRSSWLPAQSGPAELEQRKTLRRKQSEFGRELRRTQICFRELPRNDEGLVFQESRALSICK